MDKLSGKSWLRQTLVNSRQHSLLLTCSKDLTPIKDVVEDALGGRFLELLRIPLRAPSMISSIES